MDTSTDVWDAHWHVGKLPCRRRVPTSSSARTRPIVAAAPLQQCSAKDAEQHEGRDADVSAHSSSWTWRSGPSNNAVARPGAAATTGAADAVPLMEPPRCCACELVIPYKIAVCPGVIAAVTQSLLQHMLFVRGQIPCVFHVLEQEVAAVAEAGSASHKHRMKLSAGPAKRARKLVDGVHDFEEAFARFGQHHSVASVVMVFGGNTAKPKECVELVFATTAAPAGVQPTLSLRTVRAVKRKAIGVVMQALASEPVFHSACRPGKVLILVGCGEDCRGCRGTPLGDGSRDLARFVCKPSFGVGVMCPFVRNQRTRTATGEEEHGSICPHGAMVPAQHPRAKRRPKQPCVLARVCVVGGSKSASTSRMTASRTWWQFGVPLVGCGPL